MFFKKKDKSDDKIYYWTVPDYTPNKCIGDYRWEERKTNQLIFTEGMQLPCPDRDNLPTSQDPKAYDLIYNVEASEDRIIKYDVLPNNGSTPLVNGRTLYLLQELCPKDFQAFPATIRGEGKGFEPYDNHDYSVINITNTAECIDREKSNLIFYEDEDECIGHIKYLVTKSPSSMGKHHLIRERIDFTKIFCSPELVKLFKKNKIKGADFLTDEEFNALGLG